MNRAPGASLRAIIAVTEAAHPQLRAEVSRQISEQMEISPDDLAAREYPVEQLWPAIVAYAVALGTDAIERYDRRPPIINVTDYFEEGVLTEHFEQMRSVLDPQGVVVTLEIGVKVLVERLGWTWSSNDEFA